jgi:ABC-type Fe3+ transport system permease subunit
VLLVPVGRMLAASFVVEEVVSKRLGVLRAVGEVREEGGALVFAIQSAPGAPRVPTRVRPDDLVERRSVVSTAHYAHVLGDPHVQTLVLHSLGLALGAALVALLLGLPQAWALARWRAPGGSAWWALALAPLVLPPFVLGMGAARPVSRALGTLLSLEGRPLQLATAIVLLGAFLAPVVTLLVARAWSRVPAGPYEAALLLGGPGAARRQVVWPRLVPAAAAASVLVVVLALADFAVADLMTFLLPGGGTPLAVFSKEVQLQWKQEHNTGRAVATGAPLLLLCLLGLVVAWVWLRRARVVADTASGRSLAPRPLTGRALVPWVLAFGTPLALGLVVPLLGLFTWAGAGGETVATGSAAAPAVVQAQGRLFDFAGTWARTPGLGDDLTRWLKTGLLALLLTWPTAFVLARWLGAGGRLARASVGGMIALSLAAPGLVVGIGTLLTWTGVGFVEHGPLRSAFALTARSLPLAIFGSALALRGARRGMEESAAMLGAGPATRLTTIVLPLAAPGLVASGLLVLVLALRELDAVVLLETGLLPLRLYDKIHYSRLADEANLALVNLGLILGPLVLAALAYGVAARRAGGRGRGLPRGGQGGGSPAALPR